jgi:hypothetical protein
MAMWSKGRDLLAPISDEGVKELIELVYYASLMPEEGRFMHFKLVCQDDRTVFMVSRFEPVLLDGGDKLRRLAPACTRPDCALLVSEREKQLWCTGVVNIGGMGYGTMLGTPGIASVGSGLSFRIDVFGPGHIRTKEGLFASLDMKAGKIRRLSSYDVRNATERLKKAVQEWIKTEVLPSIGDQFSQVTAGAGPFLLILSKMLRTAADARHGGAFIFLPAPPSKTNDYGLRFQYRTNDIDLTDDLVKQWLLFGDFAKSKTKEEYAQAIR